MNSAKVASYVTITVFIFTVLGYLLNYSRTFVRKDDVIILEKQIKENGIKCDNVAKLYKIGNIQERIQSLEEKYNDISAMPMPIKKELRYLKAELEGLNDRFIK